ncbi:MAG TPA: efflux RND transporter periplasmic adaptor subunit [Polyangiaceae bacterium]
MADQLSRDLASLRIDRAPEVHQRGKLGRWIVVAGFIGAAAVAYPRAKSYVEGLVFKREIESAEIIMLSPIQSQVDLTATGYVTPQITAKVGSKATGRISKVLVREGETVKAGQILFELDPSDERSALLSAQARIKAEAAKLEASRADLGEAEAQLTRDKRLVGLGATAPATVEDRQLRVEALRKQVEAAEAEVQVSRAEANVSGQQLRNLRIVAPISGTAVTKPAQLGDVVAPALTLIELVDFESLLVEVDVPEARLGQVKQDGPCELVLDAAPNEHLRCKVAEFTPRMNRAKATATVKVKLVDDAKRLWPDMSARVSFLANEVDEAVRKQPSKKLVAKAALANSGEHKGVWTIADKKLLFVPVSTGVEAGSSIELTDGPAPGTRVVLNPASDFRNGQGVKDKQAVAD